MSDMSPARSNTLKASLQADPAKRSRFATAINFNTPANGVARRSSFSARTIPTTASIATTISVHLSKPKTIWWYGVQKAVRVWKSRKGRKRQASKNTFSVSRAPSKQVRRSQSIRNHPQRSPSRRIPKAEPQPVIKRTTITLANPTHGHINEVAVSETIRFARFSHPAVGAIMSALPTPASTLSFATGAADAARSTDSDFQDFPTPRTIDFRGSVNPSDVHVRRSDITREQSDRRLDGLPSPLRIRGSSGAATSSVSDSTAARIHDHQPTIVTPRLPYMPVQPPFRANSLRNDLNRCSGLHDGPEAAWAKLHQPQAPEIDQADFERFARQYRRHHRPTGNKPLPSATGQGKFQSFQPGREAAASQIPFVPERPLPTPPMPMTPPPPPPPPPPPSSRAREPQYRSYSPDEISDPAGPVPVFVPRAPLPPTPFTPQPSVRERNATRAGRSRDIRDQHKRQSQAYDNADLDKMEGCTVPAKLNSLKRKPVPSQNKKVRRSRLQADLPPVPEENDASTATASSSARHPQALRPAIPPAAARISRPVSTVAAPVTAPTAAPPAELMNGMMQAMMQLTAEVQSLRARVEEISTSTAR